MELGLKAIVIKDWKTKIGTVILSYAAIIRLRHIICFFLKNIIVCQSLLVWFPVCIFLYNDTWRHLAAKCNLLKMITDTVNNIIFGVHIYFMNLFYACYKLNNKIINTKCCKIKLTEKFVSLFQSLGRIL